ncbi:MAG: hypothetical protein GTN78_20890 [Gemmatimonadales bacterium]|nr:hypothetical protein [Gemmatimonadales bacterium]NIN12949.1 hypothetical protein [Gemmatimonadales bacterium]NIR02624.1 hypothetical protein [Gemmatimonadales bacterium]NIS67200.1 hypothetical protein [Gemmatimonadales bacterium]
MSDRVQAAIRVYFVPQTFPCGPDSSCCGPVGQTEEELQALAGNLAAAFPDTEIEVVDAGGTLQMGRDLPVIKMLNTFGAAACPIVTLNGDLVSMGPPNLSELIKLLKTRLHSSDGAAASGAT